MTIPDFAGRAVGQPTSVEIAFPLEFLVSGTPVSFQAKRAESKTAWKDRVRHASYACLPEGHFATDVPIAITLFYFPAAEMEGDIDNIVKPILDALCRHIYFDDKQVERVWAHSNAKESSNSARHRQPYRAQSRGTNPCFMCDYPMIQPRDSFNVMGAV